MESKKLRLQINLNVKKKTKIHNASYAIKATINEASENFNKFIKVYPLKQVPTLEETNASIGEIHNITLYKSYIKDADFIRTSVYLHECKDEMSKPANRVLTYILKHLEYNDNGFVTDVTHICNTAHVRMDVYYKAIKELHDNNLIHKTNKQNFIIINPLHIFKGNLYEFMKLYKKLYGDEPAKTDEKGYIIIDDKDCIEINDNIEFSINNINN